MTQQDVLDIFNEMIWVIIKTAAPLLIISLVVGLVISIFQTVTSIQEQTLTFVPKLLCIFLGMMIFGSWMLNNMTGFLELLWSNFSQYIR